MLAGLLFFSAPAHAQRALQQVLDLNRQGMEAYNNLEIEQAQNLLNQALQAAQRGGVTGSPLARTYLNLGVIAIGGLGDNGTGLDLFTRALQADPNVQLDPLTSTPDIQTMFTLAQQRTRSTGGSGGGGSGAGGGSTATPAGGGSTPTGSGTGSTSSGGSTGDLAHQPVPEQLQQTAVPVYVEVPGSPAHVYLYYRGHGMREFSRVEMGRVGRGYGYEIPCDDVFAPEVTYYIVAFGRDGSPSGFAGSQSSPIHVPVVTQRNSSAPALPGRAPPEQCREEECPPGMSGCDRSGASASGGRSSGGRSSSSSSSRGRQLGDSCTRDSDCSSGRCDDDMCAASGGGDDGDEEPSGDPRAPRFFARLGGFAGLSYVTSGMTPDRLPCQYAPDDPECVDLPGFVSTDPTTWPQFGYDLCDPSDPDGSAACFYVEQSGIAPNFAMRIDLGYYVIDWLAVTAGMRIQPNSGRGSLSFGQLYLGLEAQLTPPTAIGFHVHAHARFIAYGQVQVFLSRGGNNDTAPWATSGLQGVDFGVTAGYRFMPNFGLYLQPTAVFNLPSFLFTLDVGGGIEVGF